MRDEIIYILKFAASWILPPGIFIVLFFFLAWRLAKELRKKIAALLAALSAMLYIFSTPFFSSLLLRELEGVYTPPPQPVGDAIIMLGGGAWGDVPDIDGAGMLTSAAASRLLTAVRLYKKLRLPLLLSGGQVYAATGNEAAIARRILISLGVDENDIIIEDQSHTTGQNASYSAKILRRRGLEKPILVTSAFHMKRAVLNFAKQGIDVVPYPADYWTSRRAGWHYNFFAPSADALANSTAVLRENLRTFVTQYLE